MPKRILIRASFVLLSGFHLHAASAQTAYHASEIPLEKTNWEKTINIPKFQPSLGTLTGVRFTLRSSIRGTLMIESLDNAPSTVVSRLAADITLKRPDGSVILVHSPYEEKQNVFPAFDGLADFAGDSGATHLIANTSTGSFVLSPLSEADGELFSGEGSLSMPITAEAVSSFSGGGNLDTQSTLSASTYTTISYIYVSPDITADITTGGRLTAGGRGKFVISVKNIGNGPTIGPVTLKTTMPGGLPVASIAAKKWQCESDSQTISCIYRETIRPRFSAPDIVVSFGTADSAFPAITINLALDTDADVNSENGDNAVSVEFPVSPPQTAGVSESGGRENVRGGGGGGQRASEPEVGGGAQNGEADAFGAVAISGEKQIADIPYIDAQGCPIPDEMMALSGNDNDLSCFEFFPARNLFFTDIENDPAKRFIEILRKTRIKSSGDYVFSGDGNPSTGNRADLYYEGEFPFSPNRASSRFELVKIALITNCIPIESSIPETGILFTDIPNTSDPDDPREDFVARVFYTAAKYGIVKGYPDGSAQPQKTVNNAEILALLLRASNAMPKGMIFPSSGEWHAPYLAFAKDNRLVPQNIAPGEAMNRSELSKLLVAIMSISPNRAVSGYIAQTEPDSQSFIPQSAFYLPSPSTKSLTAASGLSCSQKAPKINACLDYDDERRIEFTDVTPDDFAKKQIDLLARTKTLPSGEFIVSGSGNHDTKSMTGAFPFYPDEGSTRLAVAKTALLANCLPIRDNFPKTGLSFTDLPPERYPGDPAKDLAARVMYTAARHGIITGYGDGSVRPYEKASALETLAILLRAANAIPEDYEERAVSYGNLPQNEWFSPYVSFAEENGIIARGIPFSHPHDNIRRSELAALLTEIMAYSDNIRIRTYRTSVGALLR